MAINEAQLEQENGYTGSWRDEKALQSHCFSKIEPLKITAITQNTGLSVIINFHKSLPMHWCFIDQVLPEEKSLNEKCLFCTFK